MAINDKAVLTASGGYVFVGPVGTAAPTPAELAAVNPVTFGAQTQTIKLSGSASAGSFTIASGADTTAALPYNATAGQVQAALEALPSIGTGNAFATGDLATGIKVSFIGTLQGKALAKLVVTGAGLTGGGTIDATITQAPNGWSNIGHTSRDEMPEFGFDGGDSEVKGTWQNAQLREVVTEQAADYVTLQLHQFDKASFELYYGENAAQTPGVFGVDGGNKKTNERAFLIIIVDGDAKVGFYASKASVKRDDAVSLPSDEFAALPIKATFLKHGANRLFDWISQTLFS
ncbi:phage tail protein [Nocardia terpenica]|uniref:Phage tail protein n=1 Tax=Nocardia terpenica TaxID=455432 RepID=A0A164HUN4_9NOCA|nr:phage tail protein [Nocardia terpenica]KZM68831.1 phage tail protein [Nocardia terpenica]NQE88127.1 phage tail protein [Nocardia terpenica]